MTLKVSDADLSAIYAHGEAAYPEECCGILIGPQPKSGGDAIVIAEIRSEENEREDASRHNRYVISPQALLQAQRTAREQDMEILGYYHSHPDHPARPTEFDREQRTQIFGVRCFKRPVAVNDVCRAMLSWPPALLKRT